MSASHQIQASDPKTSAFVTANAGSGKTSTLVGRVARLLLHGVRPEAVLCVTYTKAAAAEMQRRLFETLGGWAVMPDERLAEELVRLGETTDDLPGARRLFAKALETPGGLKIQTLHAFCEKLLRRFPLEAGVSPGFTVLEDVAAREVSAKARDGLARLALAAPGHAVALAYAHFAVELDLGAFESLLKTFEVERRAVEAYVGAFDDFEAAAADVWRVCGFDAPEDAEEIERDVAACDWAAWRKAIPPLLAGKKTDVALGQGMARLAEQEAGSFAEVWGLFSTAKGEPTKTMGTQGLEPWLREWLTQEQARLHGACQRVRAARVAVDTVHALTLARAYAALYEGEKSARGALDFPDLIDRTASLLTERADAAWVLYKLDGGIDHVLLDEAQDTAPEQWAILQALTGEFFAGAGAVFGARALERTVFAVGDEKQSIYSFQGADPAQLLDQTRAYGARANDAGAAFEVVPLIESWRSTPEVLTFVDAVLADREVLFAMSPSGDDVIAHVPRREAGFGCVDLWPLEQDIKREAPDAWDDPVDAEAEETARKRLARRIAEEVRRLTGLGGAPGDAVIDKDTHQPRPATPGDILVLVRKRDSTFEEIIRALKREKVSVAGADKLVLSRHIVFADILALIRLCLFPADDLTLAALLRSPFCSLDEESLYDLAQPRGKARLWTELQRRRGERPQWNEAARFFLRMMDLSRARTPFGFLGRMLSERDAAGCSMRQRILTRLGHEAEDALDEVLAQALKAEGRGIYDLERFAAALERSEVEVKRELEGAGGAVRVMTVHGAKGLEAPIVFLPDATGKPAQVKGGFMKTEAGGFLFAPRKGEDCEASAKARVFEEGRQASEQLRLLYVALTRARDRVVIAGRLPGNVSAVDPASWYARVQTAYGRPEIALRTRALDKGVRFGADPAPAPAVSTLVRRRPRLCLSGALAPPSRSPPPPSMPRLRTSPTALEHRQPLHWTAPDGLGRFRRGEVIHQLLEMLSELPRASWEDAARRLLAKARDLDQAQRAEMAAAAFGVLSDPVFAEVFGPSSRAEAAVAGGAPDLPPDLRISGRVDRMVVTDERVLVVDFKTNRPSPDIIEIAHPAYITQMAIYVAVLRAIYPGRRVEAALVWTDGPKLMPVPENMVADALADIRNTR